MNIRLSLIDNIGENEIRKFFKAKNVAAKPEGRAFVHYVSEVVGKEISLEDFNDFCYDN